MESVIQLVSPAVVQSDGAALRRLEKRIGRSAFNLRGVFPGSRKRIGQSSCHSE